MPRAYNDKKPTGVTVLTVLPLDNNRAFLGLGKDEAKKNVFVEVSTAGVFGR